MNIRSIRLAALLVMVATPVLAHSGHETSGFAHPFTGLDHLLAMLGVGVWASLLLTVASAFVGGATDLSFASSTM